MKEPQEQIGELLRRKKLTLAVAESCTGGLVGAAVTSVCGSSDYFLGGIISYDNRIKRDVLGVPRYDLDRYGAVSSQVVCAMAYGAARILKSDCSVSVSGIAGPGGGTEEKPVGLVYFGAFFDGQTQSCSFLFNGSREEIRAQSVKAALNFLIGIINKND